MSPGRTVIVHTWGGGLLVMPEPEWCAGHPPGAVEHPGDFQHCGPDIELTVRVPRGEAVVLRVALGLRPFDESGARGMARPYMAVELADDWHRLDPEGLQSLADQMAGHVERLRELAGDLETLVAVAGVAA